MSVESIPSTIGSTIINSSNLESAPSITFSSLDLTAPDFYQPQITEIANPILTKSVEPSPFQEPIIQEIKNPLLETTYPTVSVSDLQITPQLSVNLDSLIQSQPALIEEVRNPFIEQPNEPKITDLPIRVTPELKQETPARFPNAAKPTASEPKAHSDSEIILGHDSNEKIIKSITVSPETNQTFEIETDSMAPKTKNTFENISFYKQVVEIDTATKAILKVEQAVDLNPEQKTLWSQKMIAHLEPEIQLQIRSKVERSLKALSNQKTMQPETNIQKEEDAELSAQPKVFLQQHARTEENESSHPPTVSLKAEVEAKEPLWEVWEIQIIINYTLINEEKEATANNLKAEEKKHVRFVGLIPQSQLDEPARTLAEKGARYIVLKEGKKWQAEKYPPRIHPKEMDHTKAA